MKEDKILQEIKNIIKAIHIASIIILVSVAIFNCIIYRKIETMAQKNVSVIKQTPISLELGKMPPQSIELEEAVIGALLLEKDSLAVIVDILKPECFYKNEHQKIYSAILYLYGNDKVIDILTVSEKLRQNKELEEIGGPAYLSSLTLKVSSSAHIEFHARILLGKYIQREFIRASSQIQEKSYSDEIEDVNELIEFAEKELFDITNNTIKNQIKKACEVSKILLVEIEQMAKEDRELIGTPSGFPCLDRVTGGGQEGILRILAARPAMGKTMLAIQEAWNKSTIYNIPVLIFSLEMTIQELCLRLFAIDTGISTGKIKSGKLSEYEWLLLDMAQSKLEKAPLFIDDSSGISIMELKAKSRRLKLKYDIKDIYIDYLQLMSGNTKGNREQEISFISRNLKNLSKELSVHITALSQLNRACETRPDKKPTLADLRESGAIEQDADIVQFIYRPEYYGFTEYEDGESTKNIAEIIFAKHRAGATPTIKICRDNNFTKFFSFKEIQDIDHLTEDNSIKPNNEF